MALTKEQQERLKDNLKQFKKDRKERHGNRGFIIGPEYTEGQRNQFAKDLLKYVVDQIKTEGTEADKLDFCNRQFDNFIKLSFE